MPNVVKEEMRIDEARTPATVLLSGGLDSTTILYLVGQRRQAVQAVFFDYAQPAVTHELAAAHAVADELGVHLAVRELPRIARMNDGQFPGRNALLVLSAASNLATYPAIILLGVHAGTPYSDCTPPFLSALQRLLDVCFDGQVRVSAPFLKRTKHEIHAVALSLGVPLDLTFSCERPSDGPCGTCLSCRDREQLSC